MSRRPNQGWPDHIRFAVMMATLHNDNFEVDTPRMRMRPMSTIGRLAPRHTVAANAGGPA